MEKDAHYFTVGVIVSLALVALVSFTIWLMGAHSSTQRYDRYTIYFTDPVSGLDEGAAVEYKGVKIGKVLKIRLDPAHDNLVKVDVEVEETAPVHAGTKAQLETQGITGMVRLELTTDSKDKEPVARRDDEQYPVLKGTGTQWQKVMEDLPVITQQVREVTAKINVLLSKVKLPSFLGGK